MSADSDIASASDGRPVDPAPAHTEMKLAVLSRYIGYVDERGRGGGFLHATRSAMYRRYIDGFAGVGRYDFGNGHVRDGSALIALRAEVPGAAGASPIRFTHLRFVELDDDRANTLEARTRAAGATEARARVVRGDANVVMVDALNEVEDRTPTLVLLDPYDLDDLRFETVRLIATWHDSARARRIEQLVGLQIGRIRRQANLEQGQMPSK
ncbi:MAG: three-Cys-motif partner protein TcmP, partial [Chloroflexi bacterium]|nr:three-Cys-motif partner protein TcmP [Chloroflexota bacterium]